MTPVTKSGEPGLVSPETINMISEALQELDRRTHALQPKESADIGIKTGMGGFSSFLKMRTQAQPAIPPWRVVSNGNDTVKVAPGEAYHWVDGGVGAGAAMVNAVTFAGSSSVTVTDSGTSYIYAELPVATAQVIGATSNKQLSGAVSIIADDTDPASMDTSSNIYLLLATVTMTDNVVTVTKQHLKHNPFLSLQSIALPWLVTPNGNNTVDIAPGAILYPSPQDSGEVPNDPFVVIAQEYAGETFTVTGSGTIYARCGITWLESADDTTYTLWTFIAGINSITMQLGNTVSDDEIVIPIAKVEINAGIATVTKQILSHNPLGVGIPWVQNYFS